MQTTTAQTANNRRQPLPPWVDCVADSVTDGRLTKLTTAAGFTRDLEYDPDTGFLLSVTYPAGVKLRFGHDGYGRITSMVDLNGAVTKYEYDAKSNLATIIYPDDTPADDADNPRKQYHYENAGFPNHLTGITNENNVRVVTYGYDQYGQRNFEERIGGVGKVNLVHLANGDTTMTDHRGVTRTYKRQLILGVPRLTEIVGPPCLSCGDRYRKIDYDAKGNRNRTEDFNGNVTTYVYNARNLETSRTEAVGTPQSRTITTQWHASLRKPVKITAPGRRSEEHTSELQSH